MRTLPDDTEALLRLVLAGGRSAPRRALIGTHGTAAAALAAGPAAWTASGLDPRQAAALASPPGAITQARAWLGTAGHHLVGIDTPDYPPLLSRTATPPLALFVAGDPARLWQPAVAIVGSRAATAGGRDLAVRFTRAFCRAGLAVTSGLATGIDAAAHRAALDAGGLTIAVLGTGPDVPYPAYHADLLAQVAAAGAVVSEHAPGTQARAGHFPARNRIIAGLSLGTLVVEAAARSGALITARQAAEAGREVFAIPGSTLNPQARGCHRLIRDGACLVETPEEVLAGIAPLAGHLATALAPDYGDERGTPAGLGNAPDRPDIDHHRLWLALGHDPIPMDLIVERTGLTAATLSSMLLHMELDGRVAVEHGRYARRSTGGGTVA